MLDKRTLLRVLAVMMVSGMWGGTFPPAAQGAEGENLVQNSDLEDGSVGGLPKAWGRQKEGGADGEVLLTDQEAHSGRRSFLIKHTNATGYIHPNKSVKVTPGEYVFRFWAKSDKDIEFIAQIYRTGDWATLVNRLVVLKKGKWRKFEYDVAFLKGFPGSIQIGLRHPGRMWLDDIELIKKPPHKFRSAVSVWDTTRRSAGPLAPANLGEVKGWTKISAGRTGVSFKGDAAVSNGRILAVVRRRGGGAEIYSVRPTGEVSPMRVSLVVTGRGGQRAVRLRRVALVENGKGSACLEATFRTQKATTVTAKFRLKKGQVFVETEPGVGTDGLRVECSGRFAVMPDFFADDIVLDAVGLRLNEIEVPSENFLLHMTADGASVAVCVFENREQDVKVTLSGQGKKRNITGSEIRYGKDQKIWVALLDAPDIWHTAGVKPSDAGNISRLNWKMPFPAMWRADFRRPNDLTDSWEMLLQDQQNGPYSKPRWFGSGSSSIPANRKRWTTVLGKFLYPCWMDHEGQGYMQPLKSKALAFEGPVVIYPINRVPRTPFDKYTVVDIVRNTLGVGPCEYILDLEGQKTDSRGRATCSARDTLRPIFKSKQQRQKRARVEKVLKDVMVFIRHIRNRIELYVDFGHELRKYLAEQKRAHPEMRRFLDKMDSVTAELDTRYNARKDTIKTPEDAQRLVDEFRRNVMDRDPPDAYEKCKTLTAALVRIGGSQDELAGECRWVVRAVRQQAAIEMAMDPKVAEVAKEIRARTQKVLRNPAGHEGARH